MEARVVAGFTGLSREEMKGIEKMRRDLEYFRRQRPDARCDFVWSWHGEKLQFVRVIQATELMSEQ